MASGARKVFTRRQLLRFAGRCPQGTSSLPLPDCPGGSGSVLVADFQERSLPCCVDSCGQLWLAHPGCEDEEEVLLYLYSEVREETDFEVWRWKLAREGRPAELRPPKEVLVLADFFEDPSAARWVAFCEKPTAAAGSSLVMPPCSDRLLESIKVCPCDPDEIGSLRLTPKDGRVGMRRGFPQQGLCIPCGQLCFRIRFYDP